jgi:DnaJ-class molecular chaperone
MLESYPCPDCRGSGDDPEEPWRPCTWCHGNRVMYRDVVVAPVIHEAPDEPPGHELSEEAK